MFCVLLPLGVDTVCSIVVMMFCVGVCCDVVSLVSDVKGWLRIVVFVVGSVVLEAGIFLDICVCFVGKRD